MWYDCTDKLWLKCDYTGKQNVITNEMWVHKLWLNRMWTNKMWLTCDDKQNMITQAKFVGKQNVVTQTKCDYMDKKW